MDQNSGFTIFELISGVAYFNNLQFQPKYSILDFSVIIPMLMAIIFIRFIVFQFFFYAQKVGEGIATITRGRDFAKGKLSPKGKQLLGVQTWKLFYHGGISFYAFYCFRNEKWWFNPENFDMLWKNEVTLDKNAKLWTMIQITYHIQALIGMFIIKKDRLDYFSTLIHHLVTVIISILGYSSFPFFSIMITQFHDLSDVWLSILKVSNQLQLSKGTFLFSVVNLVSWCYYRLYLFPKMFVYPIIRDGCIKYGFMSAKIISVFLILLLVLHIYWLFLILQSYRRFLVVWKSGGAYKDNYDAQFYNENEKNDKDE